MLPSLRHDQLDGARMEAEKHDSPVEVDQPLDVERRFRQLVTRWRRDTEHWSVIGRMVKHPAYQEIIGMGKPIIPLLLAELQRAPDHWFAALRAITQENPAPAESGGKVKEIARAWIEWGKARLLVHPTPRIGEWNDVTRRGVER